MGPRTYRCVLTQLRSLVGRDLKPLEIDPDLAKILSSLAADIESHPEKLQPLSSDLKARLDDLVSDVKCDPEQDILGDVDL